MAELGDIITSKVRIKILELFFSNPKEIYHVRGIVREVKEEINAVRRELSRLEAAGIVKFEKRGNRVYYWLREDYLMYEDLLGMISKTTGLGAQLLAAKSKLGRVNYIMFSGRFAAGKERKKDDEVDILIVGEVVLPELATLVRMEESRRGREINYTVMSREECEFRKKRRDPFLLSIMTGTRVMILGGQEDLV